MNYHKVYMNHVHSSSLLCQLSTMWKSQTLCDAVIRTGNITTRAHRVVLVASCPMLQSMENATSGSHLEVRLASDIKQESINTFLQYLYEGFMMLTEENCKDVEKIARLLQVDSIIRCCSDFNKCLNVSAPQQYKYSSLDQAEFRHMRTSDLLKVQDRSQKRFADSGRPPSPGSKRARLHRGASPLHDMSSQSPGQKILDTESMSEGYGTNDPWERVPKLGAGGSGSAVKPGVIDIREDSLELVQTEPPKDTGGGRLQEPRKVQSSVGISVASQHNTSADLRIVNVTESQNVSKPPAAQQSGSGSRQITVSPLMHVDSPSSSSSVESSKFSSERFPSSAPPQRKEIERSQPHPAPLNMPSTHSSSVNIPDFAQPNVSPNRSKSQDNFSSSTPQRQPYPVSLTAVRQSNQKPFAAGSANQAGMSQSFTEGMHPSPIQRPTPPANKTTSRSESNERPPPPLQAQPSSSMGGSDTEVKSRPEEPGGLSDLTPDISIVKVEAIGSSASTAVDVDELNMYITEAVSEVTQGRQGDEQETSNIEEPPGDWTLGDVSNEGSNIGADHSGNWYMGSQFKGTNQRRKRMTSVPIKYHEYVTTFSFPNDSVILPPDMQSPSSSPDVGCSLYCTMCAVKFEDSESLSSHYCFAHSRKPFIKRCEQCGRQFQSQGGFRRHQQMYHSDHKFPECKICGKRFVSPYNLRVHEISHTNLKGYHCPVCKKSYKLKHHLKSHSCPGMKTD